MEVVKNCFGGKDERAMTDNFEELCGGVKKAQRLFQLWKNSYSAGTKFDMLYGNGQTKSQVFEKKAKQEGFTDEQIKYFYLL